MRVLSVSYVPKSYAELLRCVQQTLFVGQREIDEAWVRTYHETGRLIVSHILLNRRADYGAQVFPRLARDTGAGERLLYQCAQFYRYFPILHARAKLGWNRCRLLCQVDSEPEREALATAALKHDWPSRELERRIRAFNAAADVAEPSSNGDGENGNHSPAPQAELLPPRRGTPGLHPIVDRGDGPSVDLGFKLYRALGSASKLTTSDIVRLTEDGVRRVEDATRAELFTYTATIRRIVDGDTLLVALEVAPGITLEKLLRLRGLDCPETNTAAGRVAKRFVENLVAPGDEVILSTTKPDKYDRSLADVFVRGKAEKLRAEASELRDRTAANGGEVFLNNALLENGHAVRYEGGPKDG
jgi:endonuclease YncB( thermonuclease family)